MPFDSLVLAMLALTLAAAGASTTQATFWSLPSSFLTGAAAAAGIALVWQTPSDEQQAQFTLNALLCVAVLGIATSALAYWMFMRIVQHFKQLGAVLRFGRNKGGESF